MNYLCAAVKKEVVTEKTFYSQEEAVAYFQQKFGKRIVEKMEEHERRLENKILYLERKLKKYEDKPEMIHGLMERKQEAEKQWEMIERWLDGEDEQKAVYIEEEYDQYKERLITEDTEPFFYMGGIYKIGNHYTVREEKHCYMCQTVSGIDGCSEVIKGLPEKLKKNNRFLYVCEETPETVEKYTKQISKIRAQAKRDYYKNRALMKNPKIFHLCG